MTSTPASSRPPYPNRSLNTGTGQSSQPNAAKPTTLAPRKLLLKRLPLRKLRLRKLPLKRLPLRKLRLKKLLLRKRLPLTPVEMTHRPKRLPRRSVRRQSVGQSVQPTQVK